MGVVYLMYVLNFELFVAFTSNPVAFARAFNLATPINLLTQYSKCTPSLFKTSTAYRVTNSRSISL